MVSGSHPTTASIGRISAASGREIAMPTTAPVRDSQTGAPEKPSTTGCSPAELRRRCRSPPSSGGGPPPKARGAPPPGRGGGERGGGAPPPPRRKGGIRASGGAGSTSL